MKHCLWLLCLLFAAPAVNSQADTEVSSPAVKLVSVTILVKDYDEGARWYSENLGMVIQDNQNTEPGKRWVTMYSKQDPGFRIILHKPGSGYMDVDKQLQPDRIGKETFWILRTDDFERVYKRLTAAKAHFRSEVRATNPPGKHVVFEDLYGNLWVLEQRFTNGSGSSPATPSVKLMSITLLVRDYDEAAKWYSEVLGFQVLDNGNTEPGKRWVTINSPQDPSFRIILHKPGNGYMDVDKQLQPDRIGKETYWILQTNGFDAILNRLRAAGARLRSDVHTERWAKEVVFEDLYGNLWVLQQATDANQLSKSTRP